VTNVGSALRDRHRCPGAQSPLAPATFPAHQLFLAIKPVELLAVHHHPLPAQRQKQAPATEPATLQG
jgi:hypothetical protein